MLSEADIRLGEMLALNLPAHAEAVEELVDSAQKESQVYSVCLLFTSTKIQILTPEKVLRQVEMELLRIEKRSLLALLVQTRK